MSVGPRQSLTASQQCALRRATSNRLPATGQGYPMIMSLQPIAHSRPVQATNVDRLGLETCRSTKGQQLPTCSSAHRVGTTV
jgi:hypothetical protein